MKARDGIRHVSFPNTARKRHRDQVQTPPWRFASFTLPKTIKAHPSFPVGTPDGGCSSQPLGLQASLVGEAQGISRASRHALAVGFILAMMFIAVQTVLPFCGRTLWNPQLMLLMWTLLRSGGAFPRRLGNPCLPGLQNGLGMSCRAHGGGPFCDQLDCHLRPATRVALLTMTIA